jgi:hypothetical protein
MSVLKKLIVVVCVTTFRNNILPPTSTEVYETWIYTSTPHTSYGVVLS